MIRPPMHSLFRFAWAAPDAHTTCMLIDLHVHTALSPCSRLQLPDILALGKARGLDGICLTDHDTMGALAHVREGMQDNGLLLLVGLEYATPEGDYLLFGPFEDLAPGLCADQVLPLVKRRGGVAVAAHPCRVLRPMDKTVLRRGLVNVLETANGRNNDLENTLARNLARDHATGATGGSDAHAPEEVARMATRFDTPVCTREDLVAALRDGRCRPEVIHPGLYRAAG